MAFIELLEAVFSPKGYATASLSPTDLAHFRKIVEDHYREVLTQKGGVSDSNNINAPIEYYHEISDSVDHANLWCKKNRILSEQDYNDFITADIFDDIKGEVGELKVSAEDGNSYPEIYWRLVRPSPFRDVGPLHADSWFWELGDVQTPANHQRVKFWFALWNEAGSAGFRYVPASHVAKYPYEGEMRNGAMKPAFDETLHDLDIQNFASEPGDFIVFNDELLHGGFVGGTKSRVSFEFTLFVPDDVITQNFGKDALEEFGTKHH